MLTVRWLLEKFATWRRAIVWALQFGVFVCSAVAAFLLRFDFNVPAVQLRNLVFALPIWLLVKIVVFRVVKLDRGLWRYVSVLDIGRIAAGNLLATVLGGGLILM